jgi:hypothetical protein
MRDHCPRDTDSIYQEWQVPPWKRLREFLHHRTKEIHESTRSPVTLGASGRWLQQSREIPSMGFRSYNIFLNFRVGGS